MILCLLNVYICRENCLSMRHFFDAVIILYFVHWQLLETVIYRYDSESSYFKRQRSTKEFEIRLDEVRPIAINEYCACTCK